MADDVTDVGDVADGGPVPDEGAEVVDLGEVDAVVFDLGGVFTTSSPFDAARRLAADRGVDAAHDAVALIFGPYDEDTDHPWHRAERGELDIQGARTGILELSEATCGTALDLFELFGYLAEGGTGLRPELVSRTLRLRSAGVRTGLLTNNVAEFRQAWRDALPDELFDDIVDSSEVGCRKPDAAVYRLALERLGGIAPERAVFVDDWPGNVAAARRLGMRGIVVDLDPAAALAELDALFGW